MSVAGICLRQAVSRGRSHGRRASLVRVIEGAVEWALVEQRVGSVHIVFAAILYIHVSMYLVLSQKITTRSVGTHSRRRKVLHPMALVVGRSPVRVLVGHCRGQGDLEIPAKKKTEQSSDFKKDTRLHDRSPVLGYF